MYAVGLVSHHQSNPGQVHWQAVKRVEQYLRSIADLILCYRGRSQVERILKMSIEMVTRKNLSQPQDMPSPLVGEPCHDVERSKNCTTMLAIEADCASL